MSKSESSAHRVPPYKRPLIIGGFLLILAVVGIVTVLVCKSFLKQPTEDDSAHLSKPDSSSNVQLPEQKDPSADQDLENKTPQYEGEDPNQLENLTGAFTYADVDSETQVLHSAVMINQYIQGEGQCVFNLKRGDAVLRTASSVIKAEAATSVCGPFSISIDGIAAGTYQLEVIMTGDNKRGVITEDLQI